MLCAEVVELLSACVDDALPATLNSAIEQHIGECIDCRSALARERQTRMLLQAQRAPLWSPPDMRLRVARGIRLAEQRQRLRRTITRAVAFVAACIVLCVMAVEVTGSQSASAPIAPVATTTVLRPAAHPLPHCLSCLAVKLEHESNDSRVPHLALLAEVTDAVVHQHATLAILRDTRASRNTHTASMPLKGGEVRTAKYPGYHGLTAS